MNHGTTIADGPTADIRGGGEIVGGPTVVKIASPTSFSLHGPAMRLEIGTLSPRSPTQLATTI